MIDRTLFLPNRTEPYLFFAELCSAEPHGSAKVRPVWPNRFGHIGRTCSAIFAERVRSIIHKMLFRIASIWLLTHTVVININSVDMVRHFIIKLDVVTYTCDMSLEAEPVRPRGRTFWGEPKFCRTFGSVRFGFCRTGSGFGRSLPQMYL